MKSLNELFDGGDLFGPGEIEKEKPLSFTGDQEAVNELKLYIQNDSDLYNQHYFPIIKNYSKKMKKGIYDHNLAVKGFMYLVEDGAKKYAKEYGLSIQDWKNIFSKVVRERVAEELAQKFEQDYESGAIGPL